MKMIALLCLFLAAALQTGRIAGDEYADLLAVGTVLGIGRNADDLLKKADGPTLEIVMRALEKTHKITASRLFNVKSKGRLLVRSKLPFLGDWMNKQVAYHFQDKNPEVLYKLLGKVDVLLQLARVGCHRNLCSKPVLQAYSKYQNMAYRATRLSYSGMKQTVRLLKYIKAAVDHPKYGSKLLKRCVPIAEAFSEKYGQMANSSIELREFILNKVIGRVKDETASLKKRKDELIEESRKTQAELIKRKAEKKQLESNIERIKITLQGIDNKKKLLAQEFMKVQRTEVKDTQECDSQVEKIFKDIKDIVKTGVMRDKYERQEIKKGCCEIILIALSGGAKDAQEHLAGTYHRKDTVNNRDYWVKVDEESLALWYSPARNWVFGNVGHLGQPRGYIYSNNGIASQCPYHERRTSYRFWNVDKWSDTKDVRQLCVTKGGNRVNPPPTQYEKVKVGQEMETIVNYVTKTVQTGERTNRVCWTKKDAVHAQSLKDKTAAIDKKIRELTPTYMLLLRQMANSTDNKVNVVGMVAEAMAKIDMYAVGQTEAEESMNVMDLLVSLMNLVTTILNESQEFWDDQAKFIKQKLIPNMNQENQDVVDDESEIDSILNDGKTNNSGRRDAIRLGAHWLIFGKLSVTGYQIMREVKQNVTRGLIMVVTEDMKENWKSQTNQTIAEIQAYHDTLEKQNTIKAVRQMEAWKTLKEEIKEINQVNTLAEIEGDSTGDDCGGDPILCETNQDVEDWGDEDDEWK